MPSQSERPNPPGGAFVGEFSLSNECLDTLLAHSEHQTTAEALPEVDETALLVKDLLWPEERTALGAVLDRQAWLPVGQNGRAAGFEATVQPIGSWRASCYSLGAAALLWHRVAPHLPAVREMQPHTPTDWDGSRFWQPVGVNPLLRFIRYEPGGLLLPHYDAPYIYNDERRTLMSLVLYLDTSPGIEGGSTRFVYDPQAGIPVVERPNHDDWKRLARPEEIRCRVIPQAGSAILFDHRLLHDGEPVSGQGHKLLLRTDIDFIRVG